MLIVTAALIYGMYWRLFNDTATSAYFAYFSLDLIAMGSACTALSILAYLHTQRRRMLMPNASAKGYEWPLARIVADSLFGSRAIVALSSLLYALFFAFTNAVLIYQPSVDFQSAYGVSGITATITTCCGPPGYIPVLDVYFPAQHTGIQLVPLTVIIMVLVSLAIGVNVSLLYRAVKISPRASNIGGKGLGATGAVFGLFAGCPACAASFFMSTIAGSSVTAFSLLLQSYKPLIVGLTAPLLLGSIYFQAKSIRTILRGCGI